MPDPTELYSALSESPQGSSRPGSWLVKVPAPAHIDPLADLNADLIRNRRPSRCRRVLLAVARFAATFCIGVAATLAWQPYGDAAREIIVNSSQQLGWIAPQAGASVISLPSPGQKRHDGVASDLDSVQERIERIASSQERVTRTVAQLTVSQGQIAQEITKLREVEQYLLYKTSYKAADPRPVPAPAHKLARRPPLSIAQH